MAAPGGCNEGVEGARWGSSHTRTWYKLVLQEEVGTKCHEPLLRFARVDLYIPDRKGYLEKAWLRGRGGRARSLPGKAGRHVLGENQIDGRTAKAHSHKEEESDDDMVIEHT